MKTNNNKNVTMQHAIQQTFYKILETSCKINSRSTVCRDILAV